MRSSFAFNFNLRRYIKASVSYRSEAVEYDGTITFMPDVFTKTKAAAAAKDAPGKKKKDALLCSSVTVMMTFKAPGVAALKGASFALDGQYHCQKREDDSYLTLTGGVEGERSIDLGRAAQVDPRLTLACPPLVAERLKLQYDEPLSNFAFNFNLRRYISASSPSTTSSLI
jgi:hypothetical protein